MERAFLQISIKEEDRDALHYLWYEVTPVKGKRLARVVTWHMTRVPFETTSNPFLLVATLRHHLDSMKEAYPETSELIKESLRR